jgi:MinD-like ATPase involved in chromosome partitioning or flagellar assembly
VVITVTAPRKGQGQTITSVNLAAVISVLTKSRSLIIDLNKICKDVEYYLSGSTITRGIDDFYALYSSGFLNEAKLYQYTGHISNELDIMAGGACFCFEDKQLDMLIKTAASMYANVIIDAGGSNDNASRYCLDNSDSVLIVLTQSSNVIHTLSDEAAIHKDHLHKSVFVLNRYINSIRGQQAGYGIKDITREIAAYVTNPKVFALDFDMELMNECNMGSALNYIISAQKNNYRYARQIDAVAHCILPVEGKSTACSNVKEGWHSRTGLLQSVHYLLGRN